MDVARVDAEGGAIEGVVEHQGRRERALPLAHGVVVSEESVRETKRAEVDQS